MFSCCNLKTNFYEGIKSCDRLLVEIGLCFKTQLIYSRLHDRFFRQQIRCASIIIRDGLGDFYPILILVLI